MKTFSLAIVYSLAFIGLVSVVQQATFDVQWLTTLLQVPMVVGLIYLVLKLEDKRQASAMVREETFRKIVNDLLGVIVELSSMSKPGVISSDDIQGFQSYIRDQIIRRDK